MNLSRLLTSLVFLPLFASAANHGWNKENDPRNFDPAYKLNLDQLPTNGETDVTRRGWSASYWPETRGYIADRWQEPAAAFKFKQYKLPTPQQIQRMSAAEIDRLSPAEKIDIIRGKLNLPLMTELKKDKVKDSRDWWRGLCNGWTQASLYIDEPRPVVYSVPNSHIKVPLGTGDIKGLLAFYYSYRDNSDAKYVGQTCQPKTIGPLRVGANEGCADNDVNAAAFHIVVANELGLKHQGIAMDRDPGFQVWNQPFVKFKSTYTKYSSKISGKAPKGTYKQITVRTEMTYANELYRNAEGENIENDETVYETYNPVLGTAQQSFETITYEYVLDLDSRGTIIGGDWLSDTHPDLIWKQDFAMPTVATDEKEKIDDWTVLGEIIKAATQY